MHRSGIKFYSNRSIYRIRHERERLQRIICSSLSVEQWNRSRTTKTETILTVLRKSLKKKRASEKTCCRNMGESSSFAKCCIGFTGTPQHDPPPSSSSSPETRIQLITVFFSFLPKNGKKIVLENQKFLFRSEKKSGRKNKIVRWRKTISTLLLWWWW